MSTYRLNLNQQSNGDYEVHVNGCIYYPTQNYDTLGDYISCSPAVSDAKRKHPYKKINGCKTCAEDCHTT